MFMEQGYYIGEDGFVFIHHDGRYVIYDPESRKLAVDGNFTRKALEDYIWAELDLSEDDEERHAWKGYIDKAEKNGFFSSVGASCNANSTLEEVLAGNQCGKSELSAVQFITTLLNKAPKMKDVYRCDSCSEVVTVSVDVEEFAGNGGDQPVSRYCHSCYVTCLIEEGYTNA